MKKSYLSYAWLFAGLLAPAALQAQDSGPKPHRTLARNGEPALVEFRSQGLQYRTDQVQRLFASELRLGPHDQLLRQEAPATDAIGVAHEKFQQFFKGVRVEGNNYTVHSREGVVESLSGHFERIPEGLSATPALPADKALAAALRHVGATRYMWQDPRAEAQLREQEHNDRATYAPTGELVVVHAPARRKPAAEARTVLAWKFNIYAQEPVSRAYVYVDAHSGQVVLVNDIIKHATGTFETRYSGTQTGNTEPGGWGYELRDNSRGGGIETWDYNAGSIFTDNDNNWTAAEYDNADKDNAALDAHWGAQAVYDYWKNVHNRNSYDGQGGTLRSYVHYGTGVDNAYWAGNGTMYYGDGSYYFTPLTSLDVCAHEMGHGICETTANLYYGYESGALNEGYSDVWGAVIENYKAPNKQNWLIGEEITIGGGALRSMSDPHAYGQPAYYQGQYWDPFEEVHTNSGVFNHWFYILSTGKAGVNEGGNAYRVNGIGMAEAAKIAFRAESQYLSMWSEYWDARTYTIQAAIDLYGYGSAEEIAVTNAWFAVGIGAAHPGLPFAPFSTHQILAKHSGKALDINKASQSPGAAAIQWPFDPYTLNQFWYIQPVSSNAYKLTAAHSGQALEIGGSNTNAGALANQWPYVGGANQQFRIENVGGNDFRIVAQHSGQALEVGGASQDDRATVNQWPYQGTDHQKWNLAQVGVYKIVNKHSGQALDIRQASQTGGAGAIQWPFDPNTSNQYWEIQSVGNGRYKLIVQHSGQALEIGAANTNPGALANQWPYWGGTNQQFEIESVGGGAFRIIAVHSGQVLEVGGASTADGATINQWPYQGTDHQKWYIQSIYRDYIPRPAGSTADVTQAPLTNTLALYPNPASNQLTLAVAGTGQLSTATITDARGAVLLTGRPDASGKLDISKLKRGLYFVTVSDGTRTYRQKFAKD
ncbi:RICIN domain-containing protein [Hymenobacter edaphi]|uniref:Ricin B lectin domain-containing protein n=1 Tax=Hymenobacter edaphi TaxID=2211146 RepID=A0A328BFE5_9BACT|nr:RICIN domain-containing protein [Hymenobacter edaphi]RAK64584.1 hypothetical protein DLM85_18000 [Hymenobacter edaphi]